LGYPDPFGIAADPTVLVLLDVPKCMEPALKRVKFALGVGEDELHKCLVIVQILDPARNLCEPDTPCRLDPVMTGEDLVRAILRSHQQSVLTTEAVPADLSGDAFHYVFSDLQARVVRMRHQIGNSKGLKF
jgi:hypothetical protein